MNFDIEKQLDVNKFDKKEQGRRIRISLNGIIEQKIRKSR